MPASNPVPGSRSPAWRRFGGILRWLSLAAIASAAAAVWLVARGEPDARVQMLIAAALGAGLSVLLGSALMILAVINRGSGKDEKAHRRGRASEEDEI